MPAPLQHLTGTRYVVPLREGGSLPAVVETDRGGPYVVKFRGAGQGARALIAELLAARLAETLGLAVPRPAVVQLEAGFGSSEPNPEIQDILRGSVGANFGMAYLPGALAFDPAVDDDLAAADASAIVWFDALITNVDRTLRNTNLLVWHDRLWLIDHGAALYFHHRWEGWQERAQAPFAPIREHVLLPLADRLAEADARLAPLLTPEALIATTADLPDAWLGDEPLFPDLATHRAAYAQYLEARLAAPRRWLQEAIDARQRR
jgi:hypothetical protein